MPARLELLQQVQLARRALDGEQRACNGLGRGEDRLRALGDGEVRDDRVECAAVRWVLRVAGAERLGQAHERLGRVGREVERHREAARLAKLELEGRSGSRHVPEVVEEGGVEAGGWYEKDGQVHGPG